MLRAAVVLVVLALAVAPAYAQGESKAKAGPAYSGFLNDYSQLKPAPDREGVMLYVDRSPRAVKLTKVFFRPVEVYIAPNAEYKGVRPDVLAKMTDNFAASFKKALTPGYELAAAPGPDVLEVRSAITGVNPVKPGLTPIDFLPIKAVFNMGRAAAGQAPEVAELSAEMELLDPSGKRLAAAVANRKGDKTLQQGEQITWAHLQEISDYWAKNFRQRLDEVRAGK